MDPFREFSEYWNKPLYLRIRQGHHFLYHLSSLAMCLLILLKVWIMCSTLRSASAIDLVAAGIALAAAQMTVMVNRAVIIPKEAVSKQETGGHEVHEGRTNGNADGCGELSGAQLTAFFDRIVAGEDLGELERTCPALLALLRSRLCTEGNA